ncbi:21903_t:CDS:2, partial [Gigaspora rosea]
GVGGAGIISSLYKSALVLIVTDEVLLFLSELLYALKFPLNGLYPPRISFSSLTFKIVKVDPLLSHFLWKSAGVNPSRLPLSSSCESSLNSSETVDISGDETSQSECASDDNSDSSEFVEGASCDGNFKCSRDSDSSFPSERC